MQQQQSINMDYIKSEFWGMYTSIRDMNKRQLISQFVNLGALWYAESINGPNGF